LNLKVRAGCVSISQESNRTNYVCMAIASTFHLRAAEQRGADNSRTQDKQIGFCIDRKLS